MIAVIVITAVISAVAVPTLTNLASTRAGSAARQVVRDLTYARERAAATGVRTWVVFGVAQNRYSLLSEVPDSPGRAGALALADPGNPTTSYVQAFGGSEFSGVSITSVNFNSASEVGFDSDGSPLNSSSNPLLTQGSVGLTAGRTIYVEPGTGYAWQSP